MKDLILGTIEDLVSNFLYYDRRSDEDLPYGVIQKAIANGEVTAEEIIEKFSAELTEKLTWE